MTELPTRYIFCYVLSSLHFSRGTTGLTKDCEHQKNCVYTCLSMQNKIVRSQLSVSHSTKLHQMNVNTGTGRYTRAFGATSHAASPPFLRLQPSNPSPIVLASLWPHLPPAYAVRIPPPAPRTPLFTTLCAIYSNTPDTLASVLADVKSFGPRCGGGRAAVKANRSSSGVVEAVLEAFFAPGQTN